jgi:hypothetical protein
VAPLQQSQADRANVFRREGHYWTLSYGGMLVRLKDSKGLRDIARLIERQGTRLHVSELASSSGAADSSSAQRIERARVAVTMRIRSALGRIGKEHQALGRHLSHSIETGRFCSYEPESPINWTL